MTSMHFKPATETIRKYLSHTPVSEGSRRGCKRKGAFINGIVYKSHREAAAAFGVTISVVSKRIRSDDPKWDDWTYIKKSPAVKINGVIYPTFTKAALAWSVDQATVRSRIKSEKPKWANWLEVEQE